MVSWKELKKVTGGKQLGKGVCVSSDVKPTENMANGSKLLELDTGKKCVFDEASASWIEYGTGEDRSGAVYIKTETITGTLENPLGDLDFEQLVEDINAHRVIAEIRATMPNMEDPSADPTVSYFAPLFVIPDDFTAENINSALGFHFSSVGTEGFEDYGASITHLSSETASTTLVYAYNLRADFAGQSPSFLPISESSVQRLITTELRLNYYKVMDAPSSGGVRTVTIEGTIGNPFGDLNIDELAQQIHDGEAMASIVTTMSGISVILPVGSEIDHLGNKLVTVSGLVDGAVEESVSTDLISIMIGYPLDADDVPFMYMVPLLLMGNVLNTASAYDPNASGAATAAANIASEAKAVAMDSIHGFIPEQLALAPTVLTVKYFD